MPSSRASLALVVNWAAGVRDDEISMAEILANMEQGIARVRAVLAALVEETSL